MTAGTMKASVIPSSDNTRRISAGTTSRRITVRHPKYRPTAAQPSPAMWNIGISARLTDCPGTNPQISPARRKVFIKLEVVSMTPLGKPVVPDVYSWNATSPGAATAPGSAG